MPLDVPSAIEKRRSIRSFKSDPIDQSLIDQLINLAIAAPSSSNLQPWRIVVIKSEEKKAALVEACFDEEIISTAPVTFVFATDFDAWKKDSNKMLEQAEKNGGYTQEEVKYFKKAIPKFFGRLGDKSREWAIKDTMIAATNLVLAAESLGLSTCFVNGWLEYQIKEVIEANDMPSIGISVLVSVGYPAETPKHLGRFPLSHNVFVEKIN